MDDSYRSEKDDFDHEDYELVEPVDVPPLIARDSQPNLAKIATWLNPTDYEATSGEYKRHILARAPDTGEWIRATQQFGHWYDSATHGSLWIKAVPGAGKSVIAASMVDSLVRVEPVPVLFFFFRQIIESNRTAASLLRDWLCQLLPHCSSLQMSLWDLMKSQESLENVSTDQLWECLMAALRLVDKAYCIVDALDEMDPDENFLARLDSLGSFRPTHVKVLMTSRPKQFLQRALKDPSVIHIDLEEELVRQDIKTFVQHRVNTFSAQIITQEAKELIIETICKNSEGLFLYARLMIDELFLLADDEDWSDAAVRDMLSKLPFGLEDMYNRVLYEHSLVNDIDEGIQFLILQLVTQSARPMRLTEIAKAIEKDPLVKETKRNCKDIVRIACGPLLEIMEDEVVQILHHSLAEFLLDGGRIEDTTASRYQFPVIDPLSAHKRICLICLDYLKDGVFDSFPEVEETGNSKLNYRGPCQGFDCRMFDCREFHYRGFDYRKCFLAYPFAPYAAKYLRYHARQYDITDEHFFTALSEFCEPHSRHFRGWIYFQARKLKNEIQRRETKDVTLLHIAALCGLVFWTKHLIQSGATVDPLTNYERSPLIWASMFGHSDVANELLASGANPNLVDSARRIPFDWAASKNHVAVVRLFLSIGISPTATRKKESWIYSIREPNPLFCACVSGHVETVIEMLPYLTSENLEDALCWAAQRGDHRFMGVLFDKSDVSPDAISESILEKHSDLDGSESDDSISGYSEADESKVQLHGKQTALVFATGSLNPDCVQILVDKGAKMQAIQSRSNELSESPTSALHYLASIRPKQRKLEAWKDTFNVLAGSGADLEALTPDGKTPLITLLERNCYWKSSWLLSTIRCFLDKGANPFAVGTLGQTVLHIACTGPNIEVIKFLLDRYEDLAHMIDENGSTALHCAASNYRSTTELMALLIERGVDINAQNGMGDTVLHTSCSSSGNKMPEKIEYLLRHGADVNIQNRLGQTCIWNYRPWRENPEDADIVRLLVDAGLDLELPDRHGKIILHNSIFFNFSRAEVILKSGDKSTTSIRTLQNGETVLHSACKTRFPVEYVQKLVNYGADPSWKDTNGNTLLHTVATRFQGRAEEVALVKMLLKFGVSPKARNNQLKTALHIFPPPGIEHVYTNEFQPSTLPGRQSLVSLLLQHDKELDLDAKDQDGYTPLHFASAISELHTFDLIFAGAQINVQSYSLRTPLHCAARARLSGVLAMLLHFSDEKGIPIDLDTFDLENNTPLLDACRSGRPESVRLLIDAGASVYKKYVGRLPPLEACSQFASEDKIWHSRLNSAGNNDEFRPTRIGRSGLPGGMAWFNTHKEYKPPSEEVRHKTARIGSSVQMLLQAGAEIKGALRDSVLLGDSELLVAIRRWMDQNEVAGKTGSAGITVSKEEIFAEAELLSRSQHMAALLARFTSSDEIQFPTRYLCAMDEPTMEALLAHDVDFINKDSVFDDNIYAKYNRKRSIPIVEIAKLGLTDLMSKVLDKAKLFDDKDFVTNLRNSLPRCSTPVRPILHHACSSNVWNMEMLKLLVVNGQVDVNARNWAINKHDRDIDSMVGPGGTALHVLAEGKYWWQVEAIKYLIQNGAHVDAADECGQTPLHIASKNEPNLYLYQYFKPQICSLLLKLGADPNAVAHDGLTPLHLAGCNVDITRFLLEGGAHLGTDGNNGLIKAVKAGDIGTVQFYLERGIDCNIPKTVQKSRNFGPHIYVTYEYPISLALTTDVRRGFSESDCNAVLKLLLKYGARLDVPISKDETLIHLLVCQADHERLEPFLEKYCFDPNVRDQKGRTVFLAACESLSTKIHPDYADYYLDTMAKTGPKNDIPMYQTLADSEYYGHLIDYSATDDEGRNMIMLLARNYEVKILPMQFLNTSSSKELARQRDKQGSTAIHYAIRWKSAEFCFQILEDLGADLMEIDAEGNTALHICTEGYYLGWQPPQESLLLKRYFELGGSIDVRNNQGETPLLYYVRIVVPSPHDEKLDGKVDWLDFFSSNGADFHATNNQGETVLHILAKSEAEVGTKVRWFRKFIDFGCEPLAEDSEGRTALDVAAAFDLDEILKLFQRSQE